VNIWILSRNWPVRFSASPAMMHNTKNCLRMCTKVVQTHLQTMTAVCLTPAACYPVYPSFTGTLPEGGRLVDMQNWVFRHEPSPEPTRMQSFRVREFVRVGTPDVVVAWRDLWLQRGLEILTSLGLPARAEVASDPFFGRGGRMLAANQREQQLKFEIVVPVIWQENRPRFVPSITIRITSVSCLKFRTRTAIPHTRPASVLVWNVS
jgi:seryl-tRNA synthetase